jgi:hypothetical protein
MAVPQGAERDAKIMRLRRMNQSILRRENNLAFNRRVTRDLGLTETGELMGMKRKGDGQGGRKKKKTKGEEDWSAGEEDSEGSGSDVGEDEEGEGEQSPVKTRGRKAVSKPKASTAAGVKLAKWAETAKKGLVEVDAGGDWLTLVDVWWALEESWAFASSVRFFFWSYKAVH